MTVLSGLVVDEDGVFQCCIGCEVGQCQHIDFLSIGLLGGLHSWMLIAALSSLFFLESSSNSMLMFVWVFCCKDSRADCVLETAIVLPLTISMDLVRFSFVDWFVVMMLRSLGSSSVRTDDVMCSE